MRAQLDAVMRSGEAMGRLEDPLAPVASLVVERVTPAEAWNQHSYHRLNDPSLEYGGWRSAVGRLFGNFGNVSTHLPTRFLVSFLSRETPDPGSWATRPVASFGESALHPFPPLTGTPTVLW